MTRENFIPKYYALKKEIISQIDSGALSSGMKIESDHKLVSRYGVSRCTVTKAIGELVNEGILFREQGKGTFVAEKLGRQKTDNIGAIVSGIESKFFSMLLSHFEKTAFSFMKNILPCSHNGSFELAKKHMNNLIDNKKVDGIISRPVDLTRPEEVEYYRQIQKEHIPFVLISPQILIDEFPSILTDSFFRARQSVDFLLGLGHKNPALVITGNLHYYDISETLRGYKAALEEHNLNFDEKQVFFIEDAVENQGRVIADKIISTARRPSAVYCISDEVALGLMRRLKEKGVRIPEDISVIGAGNIDEGARQDISLTTSSIDYTEFCDVALKMLMRQIEKLDQQNDEKRFFRSKLIIRQSCQKI
jgi:GntR family transcriptional regulator of arabinose operon